MGVESFIQNFLNQRHIFNVDADRQGVSAMISGLKRYTFLTRSGGAAETPEYSCSSVCKTVTPRFRFISTEGKRKSRWEVYLGTRTKWSIQAK